VADEPVEDKPITKREPKRNVGAALAIIIGVIVFFVVIVGLVYYRVNSLTTGGKPASSEVVKKAAKAKKDTNIAQKEAPSITQSADDKLKYKGWQTYENMDWAIYARYPEGWTMTETIGSLNVVFLGPPTPAGGTILNECTFGIFIEDVTDDMVLEDYVAAARSEPMGGGSAIYETDTSVGEYAALKVVDTYSDVGAPWKRQRIWTIKNGRAYTFSFRASINYGGIDYYTMHSSTADMIMDSVIIPD
jgi:hypothetical protein